MRTTLRLAVVTGLLLVVAALPATAQDVVVQGVDGNQWDPDTLEIEAGTTVTFDMVGGDAGHDVAMDGETLVPFTPVGGAGEYTFEDAGDFQLVCTLHPGMELALTVTGGDGSAGDTATSDDEPADDEPADDQPAGDAPEDDVPADDEPAGDDDATTTDATTEDSEIAAADSGDDEEGAGGQTALLVAVVAAVILMIASFAVIRRQE